MPSSFLLFEIETKNLRDITGRFMEADDRTKSALRETIRNLARQYIVFLQQEAPKDTGKMAGGITYKTYQSGSTTEARITSKELYTSYVMRGTRPHAPPISALQGWADRHGINVWKVWWSIKRQGTSVWSLEKYGEKANGFVKRAEELMGPEYTKATMRIAGEIKSWLVGA